MTSEATIIPPQRGLDHFRDRLIRDGRDQQCVQSPDFRVAEPGSLPVSGNITNGVAHIGHYRATIFGAIWGSSLTRSRLVFVNCNT